MATDKTNNSPSRVEESQDVDRIRDIIFGSQIRDYEQRFQFLQRDLERLQQELDRVNEQVAEQGQSGDKKFQDLRRDMRQADADLRSELRETSQKLTGEKVDRATLGELFIELGNNLKSGSSLAELLNDLGAAPE